MADELQKLDVEAIIERAFNYFEKFVNRGNNLQDVLLEGLDSNDEGWVVEIGFNGTRQESREPASGSAFAHIASFGNKTTTTVREVRRIFLDEEGNFKRMS